MADEKRLKQMTKILNGGARPLTREAFDTMLGAIENSENIDPKIVEDAIQAIRKAGKGKQFLGQNVDDILDETIGMIDSRPPPIPDKALKPTSVAFKDKHGGKAVVSATQSSQDVFKGSKKLKGLAKKVGPIGLLLTLGQVIADPASAADMIADPVGAGSDEIPREESKPTESDEEVKAHNDATKEIQGLVGRSRMVYDIGRELRDEMKTDHTDIDVLEFSKLVEKMTMRGNDKDIQGAFKNLLRSSDGITVESKIPMKKAIEDKSKE